MGVEVVRKKAINEGGRQEDLRSFWAAKLPKEGGRRNLFINQALLW